jgi:CRISPR-associated endonuclease/helicase Cas3
LGTALEQIAPVVSNHLRLSAGVLDDVNRRHDPIFMQALEKLTKAWALGQKVELTHELENGQVFEYVFAPYYIEPYAVGRTIHVIGLREPINKIRTFKIERIRTIEVLEGGENAYQIPEEFNPLEALKAAWGVWYTEGEPVEVVLRFSRKVAKRVQETMWHHSEQTKELADGSLEWRAAVDEWQEMLPWIRGWGADVEVLGPQSLRDEMLGEARRLAALYGWQTFRGKSEDHEPSLTQTFRDFFGDSE